VDQCKHRLSMTMMMMSFIGSCRNKIGAKLHIYLEEGTCHKRLFYRAPSTNDMKISRNFRSLIE
jgi:hypothetical protein